MKNINKLIFMALCASSLSLMGMDSIYSRSSRSNNEISSTSNTASTSDSQNKKKKKSSALSDYIQNKGDSLVDVTLEYYNNLSLKNVLKDALMTYASLWATLLAHEAGHALSAKLLLGSPIDIKLGCSVEDHNTGKNSLSIKLLPGVTLLGFESGTGFTTRELSETSWKNLVISLTGPIFSASASYLLATKLPNTYLFSKYLNLVSIISDSYATLIPNEKETNDGAHALAALKQMMANNDETKAENK